MFIDLNVPVPALSKQQLSLATLKKGKGRQEHNVPVPAFSPAQISALECRIDMLIYLGYTVLAFNQIVERKIDSKTFVNTLDPLLGQLRKRTGILYLRRLTIVLDEESEKGFGLTNGNSALFAPYDILALVPNTATSFSLACLTHTQPTPLTTHVISLPLTLPRLPFNLKHTLVRSALKNGAVFELNYVGALGGEGDPALTISSGSESGVGPKRNWWAAAREVVRVTKGKGILVSGGVVNEADLRAPRDVANLISVLGVSQDIAHDASSKVPQSLILRAQTRRTYRAVFSEPKVVIPNTTIAQPADIDIADNTQEGAAVPAAEAGVVLPRAATPLGAANKKRALEQNPPINDTSADPSKKEGAGEGGARKKKKKSRPSVGWRHKNESFR